MKIDPEDLEEGMDDPHVMFVRREVEGMVNAIDLDDSLVTLSVQLFEQAMESGINIVSLSRIAAGCLLAATKMQSAPITDHDIAKVSHKGLKTITEVYRKVADRIGLQIEPVDPVPFIENFSQELELSEEGLEWALDMDESVRDEVLGSGVAPSSYAAALIYCASLNVTAKLNQTEIANVANVSSVTIRNNYPKIMEAYDG